MSTVGLRLLPLKKISDGRVFVGIDQMSTVGLRQVLILGAQLRRRLVVHVGIDQMSTVGLRRLREVLVRDVVVVGGN